MKLESSLFGISLHHGNHSFNRDICAGKRETRMPAQFDRSVYLSAMKSEAEASAAHWDEYVNSQPSERSGRYWYEVTEILRAANNKAAQGSGVEWWEYAAKKHLAGRMPVPRCLSLGCGTGQLERDLARVGVFADCDAVDISPVSVEQAHSAAIAAGYRNIHYSVADVNELDCGDVKYDAVWTNGSLHHFRNLEHVCSEIARALFPDGILVMLEYLGPSRFQFSERQKEIANLCLQLLPKRFRRLHPSIALEFARAVEPKPTAQTPRPWHRIFGKWKSDSGLEPSENIVPAFLERVGFPTAAAVEASDPSESVRSGEILEILRRDFRILEKTDLGGNIVQFLLSGIAHNFPPEDKQAMSLIRMLLAIEECMITCGEFESDFVFLVAAKR
jgi:SAM-dependent methyltransferase